MSQRYEIPDFKIQELIGALYGRRFHETSSGFYTQCPYTDHQTPGTHGTFRIYPDNGRHGTAVCPCGAKGTIWDLLEEYEGLPGWGSDGFDETLLFVYKALEREPVLRANQRVTTADQVRDLYVSIQRNLVPLSFTQANEHFQPNAEGHWTYRGIDVMTWRNFGVGRLMPAGLRQVKSEFSDEVFRKAGLKSWSNIGHDWLTQGVILMRTNKNGTPVGLGVRRYSEFVGYTLDSHKYIKNGNNPLMEGSSFLFGLRRANRRAGAAERALYITEGEFDALALQARGILASVAIGMGQPTQMQMDTLLATSRPLYFIVDADTSGTGMKNAVQLANAQHPRTHFIFLPLQPDGTKNDPDTFVQQNGTEALQALPVFTSFQVALHTYEMDPTSGLWTGDRVSLSDTYFQQLVENPSAADEQNLLSLCQAGGHDPATLRTGLMLRRAEQALTILSRSGGHVNVSVAPALPA